MNAGDLYVVNDMITLESKMPKMMTKRLRKHTLQPFLKEYSGLQDRQGLTTDIDYTNLSIDSRTIRKGELFVALRGENHDGHLYAIKALEKGASAIVVEKQWVMENDTPKNAPVIVVEDTLDFLQQLGAWHRRKFDIPVIGLTGSNGKTTTREMIAAVLENKYSTFRSEGNKNNHIGLPLMLLKLDEGVQIAVLEMGSNHSGEIALLVELAAPTAGAITNIGKGHIGYFGSLRKIYREKTALFDAIDTQEPIFVNTEDNYLRDYPQQNRLAVTVGFSDECDVWGKIESMDELGRVKFLLNGWRSVQLSVPGRHNVLNALLAAAIGLHYGVSEADVQVALEAFQPASQRMSFFERDNVLFINDAYNANPDSMRAAVSYLTDLPRDGKRILVLGDMLELGNFAEQEHRELGEFIAKNNINMVFLFGTLTKFTQQGIEEKKRIPTFWYDSHKEIAGHLQTVLSNGDAVLLKGSRGMTIEKVLAFLDVSD